MRKDFLPAPARIERIVRQTYDTHTYTLAFEDLDLRQSYAFAPGQFNMLSLFGIGEAPLSISSWHGQPDTFDHTVRSVGTVTDAMTHLGVGDRVWIRGPYGHGWPVPELQGRNILLVAGGIGLAPLRPLIAEFVARPEAYAGLEILYGARKTDDQLFTAEYGVWAAAPGAALRLAVDRGTPSFPGRVGPVTALFDDMTSRPENTVVVTCGPEIMMKFVVRGLLARGFTPEQIYVSLERRMECGVAKCGHCMIGPLYVCKDGPVFRYTALSNILEKIL
ncbi:MAG TPA: FAD/NAD(P)-binding protein [Symbiobacteriaceae bacterium]|jgi:NAD(P)H-flavin reductase